MSEVRALVPAGWVDSRPWATLLGLHSGAERGWDVHFWFWSPQHHIYWPTRWPCALLAERSPRRGPGSEPGHRPSLHYPSCCWQVWDDEPSTVRRGLGLIADVICRQLAVSTDHGNNAGYRGAHGRGDSLFVICCWVGVGVDNTSQSWTQGSIFYRETLFSMDPLIIKDQKSSSVH